MTSDVNQVSEAAPRPRRDSGLGSPSRLSAQDGGRAGVGASPGRWKAAPSSLTRWRLYAAANPLRAGVAVALFIAFACVLALFPILSGAALLGVACALAAIALGLLALWRSGTEHRLAQDFEKLLGDPEYAEAALLAVLGDEEAQKLERGLLAKRLGPLE